MRSLLYLIDQVLWLYSIVVIIHVILSWLVSFNVVNRSNQFVYMIGTTAYRLTEPVLAPIRRLLPSLGGIDLSPIILLLLLWFLRNLLREMFGGGF